MLTITNEDNMDLMSRYPDNYFDLAIVDPPYGISINANMGLKKNKKKKHKKVEWDDEIPNDDYWIELKRVSKNQIVWGGNYFPQIWKNGCKHFLFWDKLVPEGMSFSSGELAWTSFDKADKKLVFRNITNDKIHPTQKPQQLYKYCLEHYAKPGDKILDTHLGSGSIAIACHDYGFDLTACELDKEYFDKAMERIKNHTNQTKLF
jgi:site-specific DNA-methyltransferase (adenine-specific)